MIAGNIAKLYDCNKALGALIAMREAIILAAVIFLLCDYYS